MGQPPTAELRPGGRPGRPVPCEGQWFPAFDFQPALQRACEGNTTLLETKMDSTNWLYQRETDHPSLGRVMSILGGNRLEGITSSCCHLWSYSPIFVVHHPHSLLTPQNCMLMALGYPPLSNSLEGACKVAYQPGTWPVMDGSSTATRKPQDPAPFRNTLTAGHVEPLASNRWLGGYNPSQQFPTYINQPSTNHPKYCEKLLKCLKPPTG